MDRRSFVRVSSTLAGSTIWHWLPKNGGAQEESKSTGDWSGWRGPNNNGIAAEGQIPPTSWSTETNVVWKSSIKGRGHSTPIIIGEKVIFTTADDKLETQHVVCHHRESGRRVWMREINKGGFPKLIHTSNSHATPTPSASDGRIFAAFNNHHSVQLAALSLNGEVIWKRNVGPYQPQKYEYGYAPSPLLHESLVIVASEFDGDSFLYGLDQKTGREVWRTPRPRNLTYSSPIIGDVAGRKQLLMSGSNLICSYDPANGRELWKTPGISSVTCGTMVWEGDLVFASGGYPKKETLAVRADGSGKVVWRNREKCYEPSLLAHRGYVYGVNTGGIVICWEAKTGKLMWKQRLGGPIGASPVLAGNHIYCANQRGVTFVIKPDPDKFMLVAENRLGDEVFATPTIVDSKIFLRVADRSSGSRKEWLYCLASQ